MLNSRVQMRQDNYISHDTAMIVDVKVATAAEPEGHRLICTCYIRRVGAPSWDYRLAKLDEAELRLQDRHLTIWRTIQQNKTNPDGVAIVINRPLLNPGDYRLTVQHIASKAEYGREFKIRDDLSFGDWGARYQVNAGEEMPPEFQQVSLQRFRQPVVARRRLSWTLDTEAF